VAFEMARQLRREEPEGVAGLLLLDPVARRAGDPAPVPEEVLLDWFFWELMRLGRDRDTRPGIPAELTTPEARFDFIAARAGESGVLRPESPTGAVRRLFAVFRANWEAIIGYRPEPCHQDLTLFRARDPLPEVLRPMHTLAGTLHLDPRNGWGELTTGRVEVVEVPGDHLVLMEEPHVAELARGVTEVLARGVTEAPARGVTEAPARPAPTGDPR
jgi:thioesterase domain-containing protein